MRNGQLLLDLLGSGDHGRWLVIHGHKHYPKLTYAAGGANSPVVFAAGSLCAQLLGEHGTRARNQFYIIQIPYGTFEVSGFVGSYRAWDWQCGYGWRAAGPDSGLPRKGAFGCRSDIGLLASRVARHVSETPVPWNEIRKKVPEIDYLLPQDSRLREATIKDVHGLGILRDENGDNQHIEKQA